MRALRKAVAFGFGAGLAFGVVMALLLASVIWVAMPIKLVDDAVVYHPRAPLQGLDTATGCGTADKACSVWATTGCPASTAYCLGPAVPAR